MSLLHLRCSRTQDAVGPLAVPLVGVGGLAMPAEGLWSQLPCLCMQQVSQPTSVPSCHGIEFFSTYCDEYDPVEGVDGQILHYVSDRVGLQALFVWPNKTNKDV